MANGRFSVVSGRAGHEQPVTGPRTAPHPRSGRLSRGPPVPGTWHARSPVTNRRAQAKALCFRSGAGESGRREERPPIDTVWDGGGPAARRLGTFYFFVPAGVIMPSPGVVLGPGPACHRITPACGSSVEAAASSGGPPHTAPNRIQRRTGGSADDAPAHRERTRPERPPKEAGRRRPR